MARVNSGKLRRLRHRRVRKKMSRLASRPRLCVFRSLNHIYAQIIDDSTGSTLVTSSTLDPQVRGQVGQMTKTQKAEVVGSVLAQKALSQNITTVVFDRGGYKYHGRTKALADASRQAGLEF